MAVEKMQLVNIIGALGDFDRIVMNTIIDHDIHVENIFEIIGDTKELKAFTGSNPYDKHIKVMNEALAYGQVEKEDIPAGAFHMEPDQILEYGENLKCSLTDYQREKQALQQEIVENEAIIKQLVPIQECEAKLSDLFSFQHIKLRFGKMPQDSYRQLDEYLAEYHAFFFKFDEDKEDVFGVYFVPAQMEDKIDSIFSSLYFQRVRISGKAEGLPMEEIANLTRKNDAHRQRIEQINGQIEKIIGEQGENLFVAYRSARYRFEAYEVRKLAVHTKESFYLAGWMTQQAQQELAVALESEPNVTILVEEAQEVKHVKAPTKLKNFILFRPFESFVKMYGLPEYGEVDPTPLFAWTYSLMFGLMYGDVGHGLVLALFGLLLGKRNFLGPILAVCGIVSTACGFLYGSLFGYEHVLPTLWYKPMENGATMTQTLIIAVGLGVGLISIAMILNMINGIRQKNVGKVLFGPNGVAGFVFYWAVIIGVLSMLTGKNVMSVWYVVLFVLIPLLVVFLKEPLAKLAERKKDWIPKNKGEYVLENFFELFELILSYITNTISFIRVGAFALNHAGMLVVVFTLAEMAKGASSIAVIIIGNIVVIGLEGLLVAIQVLRLQFYELFSRYFGGEGRPFEKIEGMGKG